MKTIEEVKKELLDFLDLENTKKIALLADNDEDGLTSVVQVKKFFDSKSIESKVFFYNHHSGLQKDALKKFVDFGADKIIFLDLAEEFVSNILKKLSIANSFLIIDHHKMNSIKFSGKYLIIKPDSFSKRESANYPVSKMVYDLFGGTDWIAGIGIIGDSSKKQWNDFIKETSEKYSISEKELDEIARIVTCVISQYRELIPKLFDFLVSSQEPKSLIDSEFFGLKKDFEKKLESEVARFGKEKESFPKLKLVFFETSVEFTSILSNVISFKHPDLIIVILNKKGNFTNASLRNKSAVEVINQDKIVDCGLMARFAVEDGKKGSGGGHAPAAGAKFPEEYLSQFKKNIIAYVTKNRSAKK